MALIFPSNPTLNQVFSTGSLSWTWNGKSWNNGTSILVTSNLVSSSVQFTNGNTNAFDTTSNITVGQITASFAKISGSIFGTASFAILAQTASYLENSQTASYVVLAQTASYVLNAVSASYSLTASYVALAQTASYVTLSQTASYISTSSYALAALSASYAPNIYVLPNNVVSASAQLSNNGGVAFDTNSNITVNQITASFAKITNLTVEYVTSSVMVITGSNKFGDASNDKQEFTGSVAMTGSLAVNGAISSIGNLNFIGTGNRITGDMSNATVASKVSFQTSTTNASSYPQVIPNGTGTVSGFLAFNNSDPTNAGFSSFLALSTDARVVSGITGTGTYLPTTFYTGGSERVRIDTSGNVGIGIAAPTTRLEVLDTDLSGTRTSIYNVLTVTADNPNVPFGSGGSGFGGAILFKNKAYTGSTVSSVRIASFINDNSIDNFGGSIGFDVTPTAGGTLTRAMTINYAGNVGVGTVNPAYTLDVNGTLNWALNSYLTSGGLKVAFRAATNNFIYSGSSSLRINNDADDLSLVTVLNSGNVGIGTTSPAYKLDVSGTIADSIGNVRILPQNSQSAAYTTILSDSGKHILHPSADTTARTFTIDSNTNVAYPIGTAITFVNQNGAGVVTISITSDTMRLAGAGTTGSRTLAANGVATAIKITSTEWIISGTGLT